MSFLSKRQSSVDSRSGEKIFDERDTTRSKGLPPCITSDGCGDTGEGATVAMGEGTTVAIGEGATVATGVGATGENAVIGEKDARGTTWGDREGIDAEEAEPYTGVRAWVDALVGVLRWDS